jgi:hypothetical protein
MSKKPIQARTSARHLQGKRVTEAAAFTIMIWDSIDAIRAFAGPDFETAVVPEKRRKYLSRHDARFAHYRIASLQKPGNAPRS